ncbi:ribosomal L1 domain-containing protein CG13096-like isoform X2 [Frankliniella occidentalis]|uniref:Ribosomal L1 domain-containing protein CG13096-like isoform X2 n=1 Tax=Frankliniella occidentalis TaxID=133901 RepID=A0A9C6U619_FRAOC|nr:ribosomal L1 domain-containing protein CG13096-like isoform X2 [Frankliniella occidentalis]
MAQRTTTAAPRPLPAAAVLAVLVAVLAALPAPGAPFPVSRWTDTAVIREVYARPPTDMLFAATNDEHRASTHQAHQAGKVRHVKGGGGKNGKGYHHKHSSSGNDGYKHFDAFHTKSGDKYGYEQHSAFGKKKKGGKNEKYGAAGDAGFAGSHPDVEVVRDTARIRQGPRSQSLQDVSGDASVDRESSSHRRGLHGEDDMFFVFSGGNENQEDDGEGQQQQQAADDDDHDDDGEAAEQQEAAEDDDDDDEGGQQQKQQQADDDYDY